MFKKSNIIWVLVFSFFSSGCTFRVTDFTVISTKNVKIPTTATGNRVVGQDCVVVILLPFGIPNMKEAIDNAIENAGPQYDALIDGVVYEEDYFFIFGQACYRVEGTPINTKNSVSMNERNLLKHSSIANEHSIYKFK